MLLVIKSDLSTGNLTHASYVLHSGYLSFVFTAPYSPSIAATQYLEPKSTTSIPTFDNKSCITFIAAHGLAVWAIALQVKNADTAFHTSITHGTKLTASPVLVNNEGFDLDPDPGPNSWFLPKFELIEELPYSILLDYGIYRLDYAVGNAPELAPAGNYVQGFTGFHEFSKFMAKNAGDSSESGMNQTALANNDKTVLLPFCKPVFGMKRKNQIHTFLEHNEGDGLQHVALVSEDIFRTLREMSQQSGFEFMPSPPPTWYNNLKNQVGDVWTDEQIKLCEELEILVDNNDKGTLLQIFTKPCW